MILDLDVGNTRLKWRLFANGRAVCCGVEDGALQEMLNNLITKFNCIDIDRVRLAHVLGIDGETEIKIFFKKKFNKLVEVAKSTTHCDEITSQYNPPEKLGVDRWLAVLTAFKEAQKKCCVIDCGSAITVDFVLDDGAYIGGYIVPGLKILGLTLAENTKQLPTIDPYKNSALSVGQSTSQALSNGVLLMMVSFIERSVTDFFNNEDEIKTLFLTGGDAEIIKEHLKISSDIEIKLRPDLVLDGLSIALP